MAENDGQRDGANPGSPDTAPSQVGAVPFDGVESFSTTLDTQPAPPGADADLFSHHPGDLTERPVYFDESGWVEQSNPAPRKGWRRLMWRLSGGRFKPDPTSAEQRARELLSLTRRPLPGARSIAVVSTKGGVGKTTTALNLGHTFASIRGDRVVALDANPDAGSLGYRVTRQTDKTAADLLAIPDDITSYAQIRPFTSQAESRLEVIASPDDPRLTRRMGQHDYKRLLSMLAMQYNLILADCGTGILDSATRGVVQSADQLVVMSAPSVDAARAVTYLLSWLREHGMSEKVERAVVVINGVRGSRGPVDLDRVVEHFRPLVRDVVVIPWDEELSNGAQVRLDWLSPATRQAYLALAASLIEEFVLSSGSGDRNPRCRTNSHNYSVNQAPEVSRNAPQRPHGPCP